MNNYGNNQKRAAILACSFLAALNIAACGQAQEDESAVNQQEGKVQTAEDADSETKEDEAVSTGEASVNQQENSAQPADNADTEMTAEELLDLFISGSISAVDSADLTSSFYITDLNMDSEESDAYSVGEKTDLDNDGENELILNGPYGGIYLDARDNKVYEFAAGDGNALMLSYVYYNGAVWIMYSNRMNAGYECYHMEKFEGADNLAAEMNFSEEPADEKNPEVGMKYTLNGAEISYDEYAALGSKIFATEVNTN